MNPLYMVGAVLVVLLMFTSWRAFTIGDRTD